MEVTPKNLDRYSLTLHGKAGLISVPKIPPIATALQSITIPHGMVCFLLP